MHLVVSNPASARIHTTAKPALNVVVAAFRAVRPHCVSYNFDELDHQADHALETLFSSSENARELADSARAVLVFPHVDRGGLLPGNHEGDGVMRVAGASVAYYRIVGATLARHATSHSFSLAFYFLADHALDYLNTRGGWNIGFGPTLVVAGTESPAIDASSPFTHDVYAVPFNQQGAASGLGLEGSRIFRLRPTP
jgi:lipid-binding SYLF domain-containing protein